MPSSRAPSYITETQYYNELHCFVDVAGPLAYEIAYKTGLRVSYCGRTLAGGPIHPPANTFLRALCFSMPFAPWTFQ